MFFPTQHYCTCGIYIVFISQTIFSFSLLNNVSRKSFRSSSKLSMSNSNDDLSDLYVMVNGMPGPMAVASAEACLRMGLKLSPCAITGPDIEPQILEVTDEDTQRSASVKLIPSSNHIEIDSSLEGMRAGCGAENLVAIDFTHPSAVNSNAEWYIKNSLPFVMGTTGGDREKLLENVNNAKLFAVIAPNMGKQIVAMQKALEDLCIKFPSAFDGYKLAVTESHQKTKADTSGTAKAVVESLKTLSNDDFENDNIQMLRNDQDSISFGVAQDALAGHAFHTYTLTSADGTVQFGLQHNVSGRRIYAEGTADAVVFLANKIKTEKEGKVFTMINVLEEGAMQ